MSLNQEADPEEAEEEPPVIHFALVKFSLARGAIKAWFVFTVLSIIVMGLSLGLEVAYHTDLMKLWYYFFGFSNFYLIIDYCSLYINEYLVRSRGYKSIFPQLEYEDHFLYGISPIQLTKQIRQRN